MLHVILKMIVYEVSLSFLNVATETTLISNADLIGIDNMFRAAMSNPNVLTKPKIMSLYWPGPRMEWHITEGRTLKGLLWS